MVARALTMDPIVVFGLERSVYTRIVRMVLEEKGVRHELRPVEIFGAQGVPAEHLARHPFGRIPVLQHGSFSLHETAAIARYVDEAFEGPRLQPASAMERARMNQVIGLLDAYAYRPMVWGVFVQRVLLPREGRLPDEATIADALAATRTCLDALERVAASGAWLVGSKLTLADLHAFPILRALGLAPEGLVAIRRRPALSAWHDAMAARRSALRTASSFEAG